MVWRAAVASSRDIVIPCDRDAVGSYCRVVLLSWDHVIVVSWHLVKV